MRIAVAKETEMGEMRVALVPDIVSRLVKQGFEVCVETGAGAGSHFSDAAYEAAGAKLMSDRDRLWGEADILLKVAPFGERDGQPEYEKLKPGAIAIGMLNPLGNPQGIQKLAERQITAFSMELIPRTSRAQSMDALSSQANIAGYKAALLAAVYLPKMFPMMTTAAGTIAPAKVLVVGAGVAGLQAIATVRRLGAVVEAFDVRPAVKEEVQSVGAKFIDIPVEEDTVAAGGYAKEVSASTQEKIREILTEHVKRSDAIITTAQVPGKRAPLIVTEAMIDQMKPGSVIVDLAAEQGGNCAFTEPGKIISHEGVTIIGSLNLPASVPVNASQTYAKNLLTLLQLLLKDGNLMLNFEDDIIAGACVAHGGEIRDRRVREALSIPV